MKVSLSSAVAAAEGAQPLDSPLARGTAVATVLVVAMAGAAVAGAMLARFDTVAYRIERQAAQAVAQFEACVPPGRQGAMVHNAVRIVIEARAASPRDRAGRLTAFEEAVVLERTRLATGRISCAQARERVLHLIGF